METWQSILLKYTRDIINSKFSGKLYDVKLELDADLVPESSGLFVSVYCCDELRGCMGRFSSTRDFESLIRDLGKSAAFDDSRFEPIQENEIPEMNIEISLLTALRSVQGLDEIEIGRHGVYLKFGAQTGTYLPQVAESQMWDAEELVRHCAKYKARIDEADLDMAELFVYESICFSETEL